MSRTHAEKITKESIGNNLENAANTDEWRDAVTDALYHLLNYSPNDDVVIEEVTTTQTTESGQTKTDTQRTPTSNRQA